MTAEEDLIRLEIEVSRPLRIGKPARLVARSLTAGHVAHAQYSGSCRDLDGSISVWINLTLTALPPAGPRQR